MFECAGREKEKEGKGKHARAIYSLKDWVFRERSELTLELTLDSHACRDAGALKEDCSGILDQSFKPMEPKMHLLFACFRGTRDGFAKSPFHVRGL